MVEKDLGRIADALEIIAGVMDDWNSDAGKPSVAAAVPLPDEPAEVPTPSPAKVAPAPAPATTAQMSPDELNTALVAEFNRLGKREGIDKAMKDAGANRVNDLDPTKYQEVLNAVKALK